MTSFLHIVTDNLVRRFGLSGLENLTTVFPMQRAGLFMKQYIARLVAASPDSRPVVLPRFTTIDALTDSLCPLAPDEEISSVCTLYEIYRRHTEHTLPIDAFYGWGVQLINDFSSVDMALGNGEDMMHNVAAVNRYEELLLDDDTRARLQLLIDQTGGSNSVREYFHSLWEALPLIYKEFSEAHASMGVGTRGARSQWVIRHFNDESVQLRIRDRQFVFVGFNFLLAAEWQLMDLLRPQALFYWDYDPSFSLDSNVYRFIDSNIRRFPNALDDDPQPSAQPAITAIACQSASAQAQFVHDWLLSHHRPGDQTAVVVADESLLQAVVYALPSASELQARINVTKGYPLRNTQLFAYACSLLDGNHDALDTIHLIPSVMTRLEAWYKSLERPERDSWYAVLLDESYYQIQVVLRQIQMLIMQNDFIRRELSDTRVLCHLIRRRLEQVNIPFHGEPVTDIQVIGVLETRLLDFDHVLILNVEEGVVPGSSADRSFLPYDLRREYAMATRDEEARIYAYNFFRLFRRAQDVTLTFSDSFTDTGKHSMSRFLMQMLCSDRYDIRRLRLTESAVVESWEMPPALFRDDDRLPSHLSPSALSEYIECPRHFYLDKICHISEAEMPGVMLEVNVVGTLVHSVLQSAYLDMCGLPLDGARQLPQPVAITAAMIRSWLDDPDRLSHVLDVAYAEVNSLYRHSHPQVDADPYDRLSHEAENYAVMEMARGVLRRDLLSCPFTLVWMEHRVGMTVGDIRFEGIIDRMDIVGQGADRYVRILDYKTGGYLSSKLSFSPDQLITDPDKRYALQTLVYSEMVSRSYPDSLPVGLPIRPELLFTRKLSVSGQLVMDKVDVDDYVRDCRDIFVPRLEQLVSLIRANMEPGQEFIAADESTCAKSYCPFRLLCSRQ